MSYDFDPEKRNEILENSVIGGSEEIAGLTLRPMTAASMSMWNRLKAVANDSGNDWALAAFAFAYVHSAPKDKLRSAYVRPESLLPEVYDLMESRPAGQAAEFVPFMARQMEQFAASEARVMHSASDEALDPKI